MTTAFVVANSMLNKDIKEFTKTWQEEDRDYKKWDSEVDDIVDRERYDYYKGQFYGRLVSLVNSGTEAKALLKGFGDRGEDLDGYKALLAFQQRFDVSTTSSMLASYLEVVTPKGIKGDKDLVGRINLWETRVGPLENKFGEKAS